MENKKYKPASFKVSVRKSDISVSGESSVDSGKHRLATIMFSDICGFTKMMGKDEAKTMQIVERNKQIHQKFIQNHNGTLIKELGDGLMASFESTHDAVRCAKEIMDEVNSEGDYHLHIGIHLGDIIFTREDIFGDGVNIAARINTCAQEGEILISEEVWKNIKNQTEFRTEYIGKRTLKNVDHPVKLHRLLLDDEKSRIQFKAIFYTHSRTIKSGVFGIALVSVMLLAYYLSPISNGFLGNNINTIAVLPFENRSGYVEFEYLSEGFAEDVIGRLFNFSALSVISSRSTFRYKDSDKSIEQISRELKADIVLIGNYTVNNQQVDVKVEVISGRDNEILNFASITGNLAHIGEISSKIGKNIYEALEIPGNENQGDDNFTIQDVSVDAYKYNALGKSAMRDHTGQRLEAITQYFQAAIDIDSTYVDPYLGMAEAYIFDVNRGYISPAEGAQKAKKYALVAEKLKPGSGEVSGIMGIIHCLDYDFNKAVPYFERSLEISPNFYLTYHWYSFALEVFGDFDKAEELQKKAGILDPLNFFNDIYLALNYIFQDKITKAEQVIDTKLALDPDHKEMLWIKAVLFVEKKMYHDAYETLLERELGLETNFIAGYVYTKIGQEEKAKVVLDNMLAAAEKRYVSPTQIAIVLCGLELYDQAIEQVEEAFLLHDQWIAWVEYTSMADPLKDNPRYVSLMNEFGWR